MRLLDEAGVYTVRSRAEQLLLGLGFSMDQMGEPVSTLALAEGLVTVGIHDLRNYTHDRHRTVDDRPFGGGEGMVLKPEPLAEALQSLEIMPGEAPAPPVSIWSPPFPLMRRWSCRRAAAP